MAFIGTTKNKMKYKMTDQNGNYFAVAGGGPANARAPWCLGSRWKAPCSSNASNSRATTSSVLRHCETRLAYCLVIGTAFCTAIPRPTPRKNSLSFSPSPKPTHSSILICTRERSRDGKSVVRCRLIDVTCAISGLPSGDRRALARPPVYARLDATAPRRKSPG